MDIVNVSFLLKNEKQRLISGEEHTSKDLGSKQSSRIWCDGHLRFSDAKVQTINL